MVCELLLPNLLHHNVGKVVCLSTTQVGWVLFNILEPAQVSSLPPARQQWSASTSDQ